MPGHAPTSVVVVGAVARDLVLRTDGLPPAGAAAAVLERREVLGGKGANQAVGLAQLGLPVALVGVVGADDAGADVLEQARRDGIDVSHVVRRGTTALLVDVVDAPGSRRLLEHVPDESWLTPADVTAAGALLAGADTVSLQLQQPPDVALAAARAAAAQGRRVVLDGAPQGGRHRDALLALAEVVRADAAEAELLTGHRLRTVDDARAAARELLARGPRLVALAVAGEGDLVVWPDGEQLHRHHGEALDATGAGDAFVAAVVAALLGGADPQAAGSAGAAAAATTVTRLGGRPALSPGLTGGASTPPGVA